MKKLALIVAIALFVVPAAAVLAAQQTANLNVSASVLNTCTVSTTPVNFGPYSARDSATAEGAVTVDCSPGITFTIHLGPGNNYSNGSRRMAGGSSFLSYNLSNDLGLSLEWGDDTFGYPVVGDTSGNKIVFGKVPAGQTGLPAGNYTDVVLVTLNY